MLRRTLVLSLTLFAVCSITMAQSIQNLNNQPPDGLGISFLLTDGTVLTQGNSCSDWWKLTPDNKGSYVNGTWAAIASLPSGYQPLYFASAVLADGRLIVEGGEYSFCGNTFALTNQGAIYDPKTNKWTTVKPPKGWYDIGDSPSAVLPNGNFLVGRKTTKEAAALDPATLKWTTMGTPGKSDFNAEEGWTLMPSGSILTWDVKNNPNSELYSPSAQKWTSQGSTKANLQGPPVEGCLKYGNNHEYCPPGETGPGILRPDGTVFATGALHQGSSTGHTSVYTPGQNGGKGTWTAGPDFPNGDSAGDSWAVLLPNGDVLVLGGGGMYDFDGTTLTNDPAGEAVPILNLPNGQILVGTFSGAGVYIPKGTYQQGWAPTITSYPQSVTRGSSYKISGTQFNGLSQASAFGDEDETNTNYPLVRITNQSTGHVFYARTHNHSTMAVATGTATVFTHFDVPKSMESGASDLEVIANGIPSKPVSITVN